MVAKKRNTLRQKAAAASISKKFQEPEKDLDIDHEEDLKAFLHQHKESKKERNSSKHQTFLEQVRQKNSLDPKFAGISKSAIRRRKRKTRDDLKPKMGELLTSLGQEEDLRDQLEGKSENNEVIVDDPQKKRKNEPNIRNQKGAKALSVQESERMKQVLSNSSFRQNTFGSLRDVIEMQNR